MWRPRLPISLRSAALFYSIQFPLSSSGLYVSLYGVNARPPSPIMASTTCGSTKGLLAFEYLSPHSLSFPFLSFRHPQVEELAWVGGNVRYLLV